MRPTQRPLQPTRRWAAAVVLGAALLVAPAAPAAGNGAFTRVAGTALGTASEGETGQCAQYAGFPQRPVSWDVAYTKAPDRALAVRGCTRWQGSLGGIPFAGTFVLRTPEGELHGTMNGAKGYGSHHDHFTMTLRIEGATRGLHRMQGSLVFDGCELRRYPVSPVDAAAITTPANYRWTTCPEAG